MCDLSLAGVSFLRLPLSASPDRSPPLIPPAGGPPGSPRARPGGGEGSRFCCLRGFCLCAGSPAWRTAFYTVPCLPKPDRSICRVDAATRNHQKCASRRGAVQFVENTLQSTRRARGTFLGTPWPQIGSDTALQRGFLRGFLGGSWGVLGGPVWPWALLGLLRGLGVAFGGAQKPPGSLPGGSKEPPGASQRPPRSLPGASHEAPKSLLGAVRGPAPRAHTVPSFQTNLNGYPTWIHFQHIGNLFKHGSQPPSRNLDPLQTHMLFHCIKPNNCFNPNNTDVRTMREKRGRRNGRSPHE